MGQLEIGNWETVGFSWMASVTEHFWPVYIFRKIAVKVEKLGGTRKFKGWKTYFTMICRGIFLSLHCATDVMMLYNYLHRGERVSKSSLVCKTIEKTRNRLWRSPSNFETQGRNTEGDYGVYNLVYSLLKLESMEWKCERLYKWKKITSLR